MWIVLLVVVLLGAAVVFLPWFKGYRTLIVNWITVIIGGILPLVAEVTGFLQDVDWQTYLPPKYVPFMLIGLPVLNIILRYRTTTSVGKK